MFDSGTGQGVSEASEIRDGYEAVVESELPSPPGPSSPVIIDDYLGERAEEEPPIVGVLSSTAAEFFWNTVFFDGHRAAVPKVKFPWESGPLKRSLGSSQASSAVSDLCPAPRPPVIHIFKVSTQSTNKAPRLAVSGPRIAVRF